MHSFAHPGTKSRRFQLWDYIRSFAVLAPSRRRRKDLQRMTARGPSRVTKYITAGLGLDSWSRVASWLQKFLAYLQLIAIDNGRTRPTPGMARSNSLALEFVAMVADEEKGHTRVASAIRAINFIRTLLHIRPLSDDPRTSLLQKGVLRLNPHKAKGAVPFPSIAVIAIVQNWGASKVWWRRMTALIIYAAFLGVLRAAGILSAPLNGVTWLRGVLEVTNPKRIPRRHTGALMLITKRKTGQSTYSWVPFHAGKVTRMLARHIKWCKNLKKRPTWLFPSRKQRFRGKNRTWVPNTKNALSTSSLLSLIRKALREVCGLSKVQAKRFTTHSLRVGGINHYRHLGVPTELRAQLADHLSLASARRYLRMAPHEQISILTGMASRNDG